MTRRAFIQKTFLLVSLSGLPVMMGGCNVIQDLINFIPWIVRAVSSINSILGIFMPPGASMILNLIVAALGNLQAAALEYQNDPVAADKATVLAKIETFLRDIHDNFQQFLDALAASGPVLAVIVGIIQVILSTLGWFQNQMPSAGGTRTLSMSLKAGNQIVYIVPKQRSLNQFKNEFNSIVYSNGHSEQQMR